jgi:uncharacterized RDD family membrane protein YckC
MEAPMIYAGFLPRAVAILVDLAVLLPILIVSVMVQGLSLPAAIVALVLVNGLVVAYPVFFLSRWGQTIGKMAAGIKVTGPDGSPIAARQAWLRSSVDLALAGISCAAGVYTLATWTGPEWSSLSWGERGRELTNRNPVFTVHEWASQLWLWSELLVLLLNEKRKALHDFIAGTVVISVRAQPSTRSLVAIQTLAASPYVLGLSRRATLILAVVSSLLLLLAYLWVQEFGGLPE